MTKVNNETEKGMGSQQKESNYDKMKRQMQKEFLKYDQDAMIRKFRLESDADALYLYFVSRRYRIDRKSGYVEWSENDFQDCREAGYNEAMTIYDILCCSRDHCHISGAFVMMQNLSTVMTSSTFAGKGMFDKETQLFDGHESILSKACESLGGSRESGGDVCYRIPVFRDLEIILRFWSADEEFPADLQIFCDRNMLEYMHYETVWFLVSHIIGLLRDVFVRMTTGMSS